MTVLVIPHASTSRLLSGKKMVQPEPGTPNPRVQLKLSPHTMIWWALHQPDFLLNTGFFSVGHPSSYKRRPTGLNFNKKQEPRGSLWGEPNPFCSWIFCFAICYDSDWIISGYINTHNHFKIANRKRKRKNIDGWPSHSSLTMSLMFKLMLTSALTREGRVSPMFGFDTLSYRRAKKIK